MEPVTTAIIAALTAGLSDGTNTAVKDAYTALKNKILASVKDEKADVVEAIEKLEAKPDAKGWQLVLDEELGKTSVTQSADIQALVKVLIAELDKTPGGTNILAKYNINAENLGVAADTIKKFVQNINVESTAPPKPSKPPKPLTSRIPRLASTDGIVGRDVELQELRDSLLNTSQLLLLNGIGGVGKTCLAQAYVTRYWDEYTHIVWVTQVADFVTDFVFSAGLLSNLGVSTKGQDTEVLFESAISALNRLDSGHNLLVIDNADEGLAQWQSSIPKGNWHILVTSRTEIEGFNAKELGFLNPADALQLFNSHYSRQHLSEDQIAALVKKVDYHTLTIEILARTAHDLRLPYEKLHRALAEDVTGKVVRDREDNKRSSTESIRQYLSAVFAIGSLSDHARWLLGQFVFLPSEYHSFEILETLLKPDSGEYADGFSAILDSVKKLGWLMENSETDSYKMHAVIAESLLPQLNIKTDDLTPLIKKVTSLLYVDESKDNPVDKFQWVPFGRRLCEKCDEPDAPKVSLSALQNNLGWVLRLLGDYKGARVQLEKAVASCEVEFGEGHSNTAISYSCLGLVLQNLGDYEGARGYLEKALASDEANFGESHPNTAIRYSNLGQVLYDLGDYEGAKGLLEKAVAFYEMELGENHPNTATSYSNLGLVLRDLGDYEGARDLLEKALASAEANFGESHPTAAINYSNLGQVLLDLGDYEGARELLEKALDSDKANFGENHPSTAIRYSNLGMVLQDLGDYKGARDLLEKAVASNEANFGENHPSTAASYSNLGTVLKNLGNYKGARNLLEKALAAAEANFGENHPTTAVSYSNLGLVLKDLGDYEGARGLLEKALASDMANFGVNHPNTAIRYGNLGAIMKDLGDNDTSLHYFLKAKGIFIKCYPAGHPYIATVQGHIDSVPDAE